MIGNFTKKSNPVTSNPRQFHDQPTADYSHLALKAKLARFFGHEFQCHLLALRQGDGLVEIGE